ncbi:MAG: hypothetical protein ABI633_06890, partial [Burkholderiales bacterium]
MPAVLGSTLDEQHDVRAGDGAYGQSAFRSAGSHDDSLTLSVGDILWPLAARWPSPEYPPPRRERTTSRRLVNLEQGPRAAVRLQRRSIARDLPAEVTDTEHRTQTAHAGQ